MDNDEESQQFSYDFDSPVLLSDTGDGLLVDDDEPLVSKFEQEVDLIPEPKHWTYKEQLKILLLAIVGGFIGPFTNPLFLPGLNEVQEEFKATNTEITLTSAAYMLPLAILPLIWGPLSDRFGRRKLFLTIFGMMIFIFYFAASAWSIYSLIIFRFFMGVPISAIQVLCYSIITDVYSRENRASANGKMSAGALGAPVVAPIIGGLFAAYLSWRYSFLLEALIATFNFLLFLYILPETISAASKHRSFNILLPYKTLFSQVKVTCIALVLSLSIAQLALLNFVITTSTQQAFELNSFEVGLLLIPIAIGNIIASLIGGKLSDFFSKRKGPGGRLLTTVVASTLSCVAYPIFGFTATVYWLFPLVFSFICAFLRTISSPGAMTYSIEQNIHAAASTTAGISSLLFICTFLLTLVGPLIADVIGEFGYGVVFSVVSFVQLLLTIAVAYFMIKEFKK